ncbi:hypothetical protein V6N13_076679 [Hibiscus sabdariffa]
MWSIRINPLEIFGSAFKSKKSQRKKKFGSLSGLQDCALSQAEKRKKGVALKKSKAKSQEELEMEIEGRSLSDSNLKVVWS